MKPTVVNLSGPDTSENLHNLVREVTLKAMAGRSDNQVEALGIGLSAVTAALDGVAAIVGQREGITHESTPEEQMSTINDISTLVAALIVVKASKSGFEDGKAFQKMELNPIIYLAAIKAAEQILGREVDEMLNPGLCRAARDWERDHGYFGRWEEQTSENRRGSLH